MTSSTSLGWLVLVFQLPTRPTAARVRTWRRLHHLGAVPIKNSGYVLPNCDAAREDFEWLRADIQASGGDGVVFEARCVGPTDDEELRRGFVAASTSAFEALAKDAAALHRRRTAGRTKDRLRRAIQERLTHLDRIDFFGAGTHQPARAAVMAALAHAKEPAMPASALPVLKTSAFRGRVWVTRPRPGIDRFASAWLIRRFIDPDARFTFADTLPGPRAKAVPFDMFGAEFGHHDGGCTLDTLIRRFGLDAPGLAALADLVRSIDLKLAAHPEAEAVERMVEGLRAIHADDRALLDRGVEWIEAWHRSAQPTPRLARSRHGRAARR